MSYDPTIGRFVSEDPIKFDGEDADLYRYVGNSPTNGIDPNGTDWQGAAGGALEGGSIGVAGGIGIGAGIGTLIFPGPGTAIGGLVGGALGGLGGAIWGGYEGSGESGVLNGSLQGIKPGVVSAVGGGVVGGIAGPAALVYGPEVAAAISAWASRGALIAGLTAAQIQSLINSSGDRCVTLFTKLTQSPQAGRVLSCATDPKLAQAARQGGQVFTGRIPYQLYQQLVSSGHITTAQTLMNGVVGEEVILSQEASTILAPFFK